MSASEIVIKVSTCLPVVGADKFHYAHVLRDDGVGYLPASLRSAQARGDYVEQITYLIFLKMADERAALTPTLSQWVRGNSVPGKFSWPNL